MGAEPGRTFPAVALLLALLVSACSEKKPAGPTSEERARAAREASIRARDEEARAKLESANRLAGHGKTEEAWALWREVRDLTGETPDLARAADVIRKAEHRRREKERCEETLALVNARADGTTPEARLASLTRAADTARSFLEDYPTSKHADEIKAGLEYAERELEIHRTFVEAVEEARGHLAAGRHVECVKACDRALEIEQHETPAGLRTQALRALTPEGMVFIPGGFFLSGHERERTYLPPFYVDRTEVTNRAYGKFLEATERAAPSHYVAGKPPPGKEDHPVVNVTIEDALAFAAWAKKRLPTEVEWERAARGTDGRAYPWGEDWDASKGHFGTGGTLPVGDRPFDRSPEGVMDLGGNVMEMTLPRDDPTGATAGPVMKGGHWSDDFHPEYALCFARYPVDREHKDGGSGFRLALATPK